MTEQIDRDDLRNDIESILGDPASSPTPRYWAQAADKLLDALDRAEAQSAIRGRAVVIYRERAREAEARIKAVQDLIDQADTAGDWTVTCSRLQWAIDGTPTIEHREAQ